MTQPATQTAITYLDPHAEPGAIASPYECRLDMQSGSTSIGLLNNMFIDSAAFLEDVAHCLSDVVPGTRFLRYDKGAKGNPTMATSTDVCEDIQSKCDGVILAYGHCGSCTASLMRDAANLAASGKPVVALVTTKFEEEATFLARANGIPDLPIVVLPHPIAGESPDYQRKVAALVIPLVVRAFAEGTSGHVAQLSKAMPPAMRTAA